MIGSGKNPPRGFASKPARQPHQNATPLRAGWVINATSSASSMIRLDSASSASSIILVERVISILPVGSVRSAGQPSRLLTRRSGRRSRQPESVWSVKVPGPSFSAELTVTSKRLSASGHWTPIRIMPKASDAARPLAPPATQAGRETAPPPGGGGRGPYLPSKGGEPHRSGLTLPWFLMEKLPLRTMYRDRPRYRINVCPLLNRQPKRELRSLS